MLPLLTEIGFTRFNDYPSLITTSISFLIFGLLFYLIYRSQIEKTPIWKAVVVVLVGRLAFFLDIPILSQLVQFPILPLGVWVLYWIMKRKDNGERWLRYRKFAWLGFWVNFVFLTVSLLTVPVHSFLFPADEASTYIAMTEHASLIVSHPSGETAAIKKTELGNQLGKMKESKIKSESWYYDIVHAEEKNERFPYVLLGTEPKQGSGLKPIIFIEEDGKGLLITTGQEQHYFRSTVSVLAIGGQKNE